MTRSTRSFSVSATAALGALACAAAVLVGLATPAAAAACPPSDPATGNALAGDFNGDGHADAVVGEPGRGGSSGGVHVLYGTADGLTADAVGSAPDDQVFTQDTAGVLDTAENGDAFGAAVAVGDFNGDLCADAAIGAPGENDGSGAVTILYGSLGSGLTAAGNVFLSQAGDALPGESESGDRFGATLAAGSFNGTSDDITDLAVGGPGEAIGGGHDDGAVWLLYGDTAGLDQGTDAKALHQGIPGVPGVPESGDRFGAALAFGFFRGDCLAVGVPGENGSAGMVEVFAGDGIAGGIRAFSQNTPRVPGVPEAGDQFGAALAAGDTTGFGYDDLAVGVPGENGERGAVNLLQSSESGLNTEFSDDPLAISQATPGVNGAARPGDEFGAALQMGRLDGGIPLDLAVGVPGDGIGFGGNVGAVNVLFGATDGLGPDGDVRFHQDVAGIGGAAEVGDRFGISLSALPVQNGGIDNLLIGVPFEDGGSLSNTGLFHVLATNEFGPNPSGSQTWSAASPGVKGALIPTGRLARDLD
ncbi:MAG: hypothetical protein GEV07_06765 [Streptosporangiales bacterium]|nr:hypothetical protein [Streptosporangiales bacterium]